ncbi:MAG: DNA polymerase III subunit beta [Epsilonproteobacteria bacterium]|nr:DNA polymerase III subunit beta [Campylobacterota bacterium]
MSGQFTVNPKELLSLLSAMQPICNKRTTLDVTETILFHVAPRELTLKATDLEVSLQSTMPIESDLDGTTSFLISGRRIFEVVKELDEPITLHLHDTSLKLVSGSVELVLNIKDAQQFPPFPERIENLMELDGQFLLTLLNKVAFLIPSNNANPALNGLLFEVGPQHLAMVATDGHCLARITTAKYTLEEEKNWLMPKRAIVELKKILESGDDSQAVFLGTCGNQVVFSGKNFNFFTKLISEKFPTYQAVLDREGFMPARLSKDAFLRTLKRTSCLLAGQFVSTNFTFDKGAVHVNLHNKDVGRLEESLTLEEYDGDAIESRFYSPYLLNGLQVFPDQQVAFHIKNNIKPIIFDTKTEEYDMTYLVMPVSLSQTGQEQ